jgi:hypothetical protein
MPTKMDWVRLAAFIDGEGMIDIHTHTQFQPSMKCRYTTRYVRVVMVNTDPRLAIWCKDVFGGHVGVDRKRPTHGKWRNTLRWYVSTKKAVSIIKGCLPYFLLKREQAELAIAFQDTVRPMGPHGHPKETMDRRIEIQQQMKLLKRAQSIPSDYVVH